MEFQSVATILVLALVGGSQSDGIPQDLSFVKSIIEPYAFCKVGTLSCTPDCMGVQLCMGNLQLEIVEECTASMCDTKTLTCNPDLKKCNAVDPDKFKCHGKVGGRFSNPYDCHSYFECTDPITPLDDGVKVACEPPTNGFDPLTGMCLFPSSHRVCIEGPVPICENPMQSGALKENTNMYYICVSLENVLQPVLARCDNENEIFQNGQCVRR